ncbi:trifunctional uridine nucleosidase/nicotinamide riboside hydrolase/nicotinic acid riboside hydrolase [Pichia kluyveri]|uniref:Trifunctional uridine nucleosidase/nicotinamide riboside hydrolase/nicotinic acid riboside hydrolase n=1 Tax=Pichia kluyveri TaxID=36015 RepID=A0AAV5R448_PICKL|nr:trifunctional uridine nucleosidase/nicotinamide riboside hydrolase/nicotinic acid riboside hydrolase [Pichia kluyveri]
MTISQPIPIWLDCDPGQDDAVAIIVATYSPYFNLLGISTVHGNVSLKYTTSNTLRLLTALNKTDILVFPGETVPLNNYKEVNASYVHGETGLNGSNLLLASRMTPKDNKDFFSYLAKQIETYEGLINIIATGPLTNMAVFFKEYPHLKSKIKFLSIMGGGFTKFNVNNNAEFNYYCDPFAAKIIIEDSVLSSRIIQASLDITEKIFITDKIQKRVLKGKSVETTSNFRAMLFQLIDSFNKRMLTLNKPNYKGPVIHDPVAVVALLQFNNITEEFDFQYKRRKFEISIEPSNYGSIQSVKEDVEDGIYCLLDLNVDAFWNEVLQIYTFADDNAFMNTLSRDELIAEYNAEDPDKYGL